MNPESGEFAVIVPAAGRSSRFGDPAERKVFADLDGRAVWHRAVEPFLRRDDVAQITIVIGREDRELFGRRFGPSAAVFDLRVVATGFPDGTVSGPYVRRAGRSPLDPELTCVSELVRWPRGLA